MKFKAGIIQHSVKCGDIEYNKQVVFAKIRQLERQNVSLIVLPELWATGFAYKELELLAKQTPSLIHQIQEIISKKTIVIGTFAQIYQRKIYNTAFVIAKEGILGEYQKIHLFSPLKEDKHFARGWQWQTITSPLGNLGIMICYDLRFPELARCLTLRGAEILVVPASWPQTRAEHWKVLLRARAIENQVFVIGANACGIQGQIKMGGNSVIISPWGEILARANEKETILKTEIDTELIKRAREIIPCLKERRPEVYHVQRKNC